MYKFFGKVFRRGSWYVIMLSLGTGLLAGCSNMPAKVRSGAPIDVQSLTNSLRDIEQSRLERVKVALGDRVSNQKHADYLTLIIKHNAITRFIRKTGRFPNGLSEVKEEGYFFFDLPLEDTIVDWRVEGDTLYVDSFYVDKYLSSSSSDEVEPSAVKIWTSRFILPGSRREQQLREGREKHWRWFLSVDPEQSKYIGFTLEDLDTGEFPVLQQDLYKHICKDDVEEQQFMWSKDLCHQLVEFALHFAGEYGRYPLSAKELLDFIGKPIEKAWIAPLTGKQTVLKDVYDGENPAYESFDNGRTFTVIVPLYGVGSDIADERYARYAKWTNLGLHLGRYFRITRSYDVFKSMGFSYQSV